MNDIILSKKVSIECCLKQIDQYYHLETALPFVKDQLRLDDEDMMRKLQGMVGFGNILVHEYQELNMQILIDVIEHRTQDLLEFFDQTLRSGV